MYAQDLLVLIDHLAAGKPNPVIDRTLALEEGK